MKKKLISTILVAAMAVSMLAGCGSTTNEDTAKTSTDSSDADTVVEITDHTNGGRSYLTGEEIGEDIAATRPIACMIENTSACLPQYGINKAGVIYESAVEGGITRMMAIFDDVSGMDQIGNVRSARPYYVYFAKEWDAIYCHFGGSDMAKDLISTRIVDDIDGLDGAVGDGVSYYRSSDRKAPHNAYTSAEGIAKGIEIKGYSTDYSTTYAGHNLFAGDDEEITLDDGEDVGVIQLYYFNNEPWFVYNEDTKTYARYEFGKAQTDAADGEQIEVTNIIFENAPWSIYEGTQYLNIPLTGTGTGKYFTRGKMIDITWEKDSDTSVTHYYDEDGNEIVLNQGKTWFCLIQDTYADSNKFYKDEAEFNAAN